MATLDGKVILLTGATEQAYDPGARARLRALSADLAGLCPLRPVPAAAGARCGR